MPVNHSAAGTLIGGEIADPDHARQAASQGAGAWTVPEKLIANHTCLQQRIVETGEQLLAVRSKALFARPGDLNVESLLKSSTAGGAKGTMNFSIPDDIKESFKQTFANENKRTVVAKLLQEAVTKDRRKEQSDEAIEGILAGLGQERASSRWSHRRLGMAAQQHSYSVLFPNQQAPTGAD